MQTARQVPFTIEIACDPTKIEVNISYAVQARIEDSGQHRFVNDQCCSVVTRGAPAHVDMVLRSVGTPGR